MKFEEKKFEDRENSIIKALFRKNVGLSKIRTKLQKKLKTLPIEIWREEIKPVVSEDFEFEDRDKS